MKKPMKGTMNFLKPKKTITHKKLLEEGGLLLKNGGAHRNERTAVPRGKRASGDRGRRPRNAEVPKVFPRQRRP